MPFPALDDPLRCPSSGEQLPGDAVPDAIWHRCPACRRLIAEAGRTGRFHAHKVVPGRRNDAVQETLHAHGLNRRERDVPPRYAEPERAR